MCTCRRRVVVRVDVQAYNIYACMAIVHRRAYLCVDVYVVDVIYGVYTCTRDIW